MFVANIAPIMIVAGVCGLGPQDTASLIQTAMIVAGVGTLVQLFSVWKVGARLPIVMGVSFTFVSIFCFVGPKWGFGAVLGAAFAGGIIEGLLGFFAKYWRRIISPIVAACVVTAIGFSLLPVGANSFAGGFGAKDFGSVQNWVLGTFTLVSCIGFNIFAKGNLKPLSVLFGLVAGYILALFMGKVDLSLVASAGLVSLPHFMPFELDFNLSAIISVTMIYLVSATETIGDTTAMTSTVLKRDATDKEISGSIACDGFVSSLSSLFGCLPITSFSQNIGLLAMTKVVNRYAIATGAGIMILAGIFPIVGAVLASLPEAVLGGCTIMMFGNIVIAGLMMIGSCGYSQRNIVIAALSLSVGLGFTQAPQMFAIFPDIVRTVFAENCVAVVFIAAIIMNLIMPQEGEIKAKMPLK
jgi:NCS2 family nucleobase:cation symporter-2